MLILFLAGAATALATGVGAIPVFFLGERAEALRPVLLGAAAGVMGVASIAGLLLPGLDEGSAASVAGGAAVGIVFLLVARRAISRREEHLHRARREGLATSVLVFVVLFVHSLPEGFAIGTAYASDTEGLSLFVILAIAIQNIPEGTSIAIPMSVAGFSRSRQFWVAVGTSAPQPIGALVAYALVSEVKALLPFSFGFAAGAMLALIFVELLPQAWRGGPAAGLAGVAIGGGLMLAISAVLGV
ncbi:MAG: ZIP family metal transporter [Solirubrobacterales bacterium]